MAQGGSLWSQKSAMQSVRSLTSFPFWVPFPAIFSSLQAAPVMETNPTPRSCNQCLLDNTCVPWSFSPYQQIQHASEDNADKDSGERDYGPTTSTRNDLLWVRSSDHRFRVRKYEEWGTADDELYSRWSNDVGCKYWCGAPSIVRENVVL